MEIQGKALATARNRLAAIAAAHRLGKHPDPMKDPLVKATLKRLAREYGKPRHQARGLTAESLAAVKATSRIQRVHKGKRLRKETEAQAAERSRVDLALLQVMRDGLLRRSEAAALTWGNVELQEDGSGRLHVARSKTDQSAEGVCQGRRQNIPVGCRRSAKMSAQVFRGSITETGQLQVGG